MATATHPTTSNSHNITNTNPNQTLLGTLLIIKKSGNIGKGLRWYNDRTSTGLTIGREEQCDVRVQIPTASRRHCRISYQPAASSNLCTSSSSSASAALSDVQTGAFYIQNYSKVNPTTLNGHPLKPNQLTFLPHNAKIGVSDRFFLFQYQNPLEDSVAVALAEAHRNGNDSIIYENNDDENIPPSQVKDGNADVADVTCELSKFVRTRRHVRNRPLRCGTWKDFKEKHPVLTDEQRKDARAKLRELYELKDTAVENVVRMSMFLSFDTIFVMLIRILSHV